MQTKSVPFELKRAPDEDVTIEGYASVFEVVDNGLDVVSRGAFRKSLDVRKPKMLWQHEPGEPIGFWDEVREDEKGLYVKGRIFKDIPRGAHAITAFRKGSMDSLSIGYSAKQASPEGGGRVRRLDEIELFEISLVTFPMLDEARAQVKSIDWTNKRDIEAGLRDAFRLSQSEAKAFIASGFAGLAAKRDVSVDQVDSAEANALQTQIKELQEKFNV